MNWETDFKELNCSLLVHQTSPEAPYWEVPKIFVKMFISYLKSSVSGTGIEFNTHLGVRWGTLWGQWLSVTIFVLSLCLASARGAIFMLWVCPTPVYSISWNEPFTSSGAMIIAPPTQGTTLDCLVVVASGEIVLKQAILSRHCNRQQLKESVFLWEKALSLFSKLHPEGQTPIKDTAKCWL